MSGYLTREQAVSELAADGCTKAEKAGMCLGTYPAGCTREDLFTIGRW